MILSAGLTPAWQQILTFDSLRLGEVNRAARAVWCASGKVFNAGIAAHHLGGPSMTLAPVGGPAAGAIEAELSELGVPHRLIHTAAATRVCTTVIDESTGTMTELVENGRAMSAGELEEFRLAYAEHAAQAEVVVLIGSLPAGAPESYYRELMELTPCPAVLDFRGQGLLSVLDLKPLLVKPNREELARTVGGPVETDAELLGAMRWLNDRGARHVLVTQGPGAVWLSSAGKAWRLSPPAIADVVNPIGSGDAVAATIAWACRAGMPMLEAARLAIAAAGQNCRQLLPCRLDPSTLPAEAARVTVETIKL
jgi:1-phosphofructokinase family hexose kinase